MSNNRFITTKVFPLKDWILISATKVQHCFLALSQIVATMTRVVAGLVQDNVEALKMWRLKFSEINEKEFENDLAMTLRGVGNDFVLN